MSTTTRLERPSVPALDEILGKRFDVLDDGFVRLVDYMGNDDSIVQAARVSYGKGTKKASSDKNLIRYLMRHRHSTPFEMCELKIHVRVPMDCWRQWIRHRTACLSGDAELHFDLPGGIKRCGNQLYKLKVKDIFNKFQPTENKNRPDKQRNKFYKRDAVQKMYLRSVDEKTGEVYHTRIVDVWESGKKTVIEMSLANSMKIKASCDHRFLSDGGWETMAQIKERWIKGQNPKVLTIGPKVGKLISNIEDKIEHRDTTCLSSNWTSVIDFNEVGQEMTYDIEVEGPYHNFSANGIVTHNSVNEYSTRYSEAIDSCQTTRKNAWRLQASNNKQGSDGFACNNTGSYLSTKEQELHELSRITYNERLEQGVAREQARKDLPLSTYTEAYWKCNLKNLLHFLALRMDSHAQKEIRDYATIIGEEIVAKWVPVTWEAFNDYHPMRDGMTLTSREKEIIAGISSGTSCGHAESFGWLKRSKKTGKLKRNRERSECEEKLKTLGLEIPWGKSLEM